MNSTAAFLKHVLPGGGYYVAAVFRGERVAHTFHDSVDSLSAELLARDSQGLTVYHACASYRDRTRRRGQNALASRAFWLDIDLVPKSRYVDVQDAAEDVARFCRETGLPAPVYVSSGHGLHIYWPLETALGLDEW